jgi:hypothetical protein
MGGPAFFVLGKRSSAFLTQERDMIRPWTAAIFLLTTNLWAGEQQAPAQDKTDLSGLLSGEKKPCDGEKKKAEAQTPPAEAQKAEAALEGLIGAEKKPDPAPKSLGAVPALGNCK